MRIAGGLITSRISSRQRRYRIKSGFNLYGSKDASGPRSLKPFTKRHIDYNNKPSQNRVCCTHNFSPQSSSWSPAFSITISSYIARKETSFIVPFRSTASATAEAKKQITPASIAFMLPTQATHGELTGKRLLITYSLTDAPFGQRRFEFLDPSGLWVDAMEQILSKTGLWDQYMV